MLNRTAPIYNRAKPAVTKPPQQPNPESPLQTRVFAILRANKKTVRVFFMNGEGDALHDSRMRPLFAPPGVGGETVRRV